MESKRVQLGTQISTSKKNLQTIYSIQEKKMIDNASSTVTNNIYIVFLLWKKCFLDYIKMET